MKRIKIVCVAAGFALLAALSGCSALIDKAEPRDSVELTEIEKARRSELLAIKATWNVIATEEEIKTDLLQHLETFFGADASIKISKIDSIDSRELWIDPDEYAKKVRSVSPTVTRLVATFDVYAVETADWTGHALTSNNRQLGTVLYVSEEPFSTENNSDDFSAMYRTLLENYVYQTAYLASSITDQEITEYKNRFAYEIIATNPEYTFSKWEKHSGNISNILTTNWNQGNLYTGYGAEPYNNCLIAIKKAGVYAGCGPVMVAQMMAFHKFPNNLSSPNKNLILSNWQYASGWDGTYDWNVLLQNPIANYPAKAATTNQQSNYDNVLSRPVVKMPAPMPETPPLSEYNKNFNIQVGALMYDVAEGCKATYKADATSTYSKDCFSYLKSLGYEEGMTTGYSFEFLRQSIDAGCPVPLEGYSQKTVTSNTYRFLWWSWEIKSASYQNGHFFIADGYYNMSCQARSNKEGKTIPITADFVHINPGWGGNSRGYYLSGVFNMANGALAKDYVTRKTYSEGTDYFFKYNLKQHNMLKPSR